MTATSTLDTKIQELCEAILSDEEVTGARSKAETFLNNEQAVALYREMAMMGRSLHEKQHGGQQPTEEEVDQFNALKERCEASPEVSGFLGAQQFLSGIAEKVSVYVGKTLEHGTVPTEEEMNSSGSCGEGCGCH